MSICNFLPHDFIYQNALHNYTKLREHIQEEMKIHPDFKKLLISQSLLEYGIITKNKDLYLRSWEELKKYQNVVLEVDTDGMTYIVHNKEYTQEYGYITMCNILKEEREQYELLYKVLMKNNYFHCIEN